ncbi:MAG: glycosyltransferase [Verrucomicrobia bacterium]|nr:glycosyltransferase [Verrucomicrobiota bacterium]
MNQTEQASISEGVKKSPSKSKLLAIRGFGLLVSSILLFMVYKRLEPGVLLDSLKRADLRWIIMAVCAFAINLIFASYRWHLMLRLSHLTIHPEATLRAVSIGHCFNTFLFGTAGGDFIKSVIYSRWYRLSLTDVLAIAPLDRFFGLLGALVFGVFMALIGYLTGGFDDFDWIQLRLPVFWAIGLAGVLAGSMWILSHWKGQGTSRLGLFLNQLRRSAGILWNNPQVALKAAGAAIIVHLSLSLVMAFNLKAVSQHAFEWWNILWIFPVISIFSGLPVSIGGAGLREGSALILLGIYAIPGEDAVMGALLTLGVYFLWAFIGLILWQLEKRRQRKGIPLPKNPSVSIVIPTYNEQDQIETLAYHLRRRAPEAEWILADGGSTDATLDQAKKHPFKTISSPRGRGTQMHHGAAVATGDVILFLHADTQLPAFGIESMLRCLKDNHVAGGGFWKQFNQAHWLMIGSKFRCLPRVLFGGYVFGDQGIFVRRDILQQSGGVPKVPLMEEFELCKALRYHGRIALADSTIITSSRRFFANGVMKTYLLMGRLILLYRLGYSTESLAKAYSKLKSR